MLGFVAAALPRRGSRESVVYLILHRNLNQMILKELIKITMKIKSKRNSFRKRGIPSNKEVYMGLHGVLHVGSHPFDLHMGDDQVVHTQAEGVDADLAEDELHP